MSEVQLVKYWCNALGARVVFLTWFGDNNVPHFPFIALDRKYKCCSCGVCHVGTSIGL